MRDPRALTCQRSDPHVTRGKAICDRIRGSCGRQLGAPAAFPALSAFLAPDLVAVIKVRNVGEFSAQAKWRVLSINADRGLEGAEVLCEVEMLVLREMLIGEDQDRILRESLFNCLEIGRTDLSR